MRTPLRAGLLALVMPAALAVAPATPGASNLTVTQCTPRLIPDDAVAVADEQQRYEQSVKPYAGRLTVYVDFANHSTVAATKVTFALADRDSLIVGLPPFSGSFAPNAPVSRRFDFGWSAASMPPFGQARCVVLRVEYADGSVWVEPNPPPWRKW